MKNCSRYQSGKCQSPVNPQPLENFHRKKSTKDGRRPHCKSCEKKYSADNSDWKKEVSRKWHRENTDRRLDTRYKKLYGVGLDHYNQMMSSQNHSCAICKTHYSKFTKRMPVDHCHKTGKVRGILCDKCNQAIGALKDNPELMEAAANYVRRYQ